MPRLVSEGHNGVEYCATIELDNGTQQKLCMPMSLYHKELEPRLRKIDSSTVGKLKGKAVLRIMQKYHIVPSGVTGVDQ